MTETWEETNERVEKEQMEALNMTPKEYYDWCREREYFIKGRDLVHQEEYKRMCMKLYLKHASDGKYDLPRKKK